tara:strand:+ start:3176 stop:3361 length:186 start_codon:yes stop_codon:yes gene_type:complete
MTNHRKKLKRSKNIASNLLEVGRSIKKANVVLSINVPSSYYTITYSKLTLVENKGKGHKDD